MHATNNEFRKEILNQTEYMDDKNTGLNSRNHQFKLTNNAKSFLPRISGAHSTTRDGRFP